MKGFCFLIVTVISSARILKGSTSLTLKRVMSEFRDISDQKLTFDVPFNNSDIDDCGVRLGPLSTNLLEWHFSFLGAKESPFEDGIYHGKIILPPQYPRRAPRIQLLTPSGRWKVQKDICLSGGLHNLLCFSFNC